MARRFDPCDLEIREQLLSEHPVLERDYTVATPMINRAYKLVRNHVWTRQTGLVFFSQPRMGKTRCAMSVKDRLSVDFPSIHSTILSARASLRYSESHLPRMILEAENHASQTSGRPSKLLESTIADIRVKVGAKKGKQYVLIIDEAHLLNEGDWQQLVCLHNTLELNKIKMTTISFAQPAILHRRTALQVSHDEQIIARFLSIPVSFEGCRSHEDLLVLLHAFDSGSEYPDDSKCSYTNFFVPMAFQGGFSLTKYVDNLWQAFSNSVGSGLGGMVSIELICLALGQLLLALRAQDSPDLVLSDAEIETAITYCNFHAYHDVTESVDV